MSIKKRRGFSRGALAVAAAAGLAVSARAATPTITYVLSPNDDGHGNSAAGSFALYAIDSTADGNQGISGFQADITGFTTLLNVAPQGIYDNGTGTGNTVTEGFTLFRSGANVDPIFAAQDTGSPDRSKVKIIYGFGQTAGNLDAQAPAGSTGGSNRVQTAYDAKLLIATGTFTNLAALTFTSGTNNQANVFLTNTSIATVNAAIVPVSGLVDTYTGPSGSFSNGANWFPTVPVLNDTALITGTSGAVTVTFDASANNVSLSQLTIDGTGGATRTLAQSANSLSATNESVGLSGVGTLSISGGSHSVTGTGTNGLSIGVNAGSVGTVNLSGGSLTVSGNTAIGLAGTGAFNQTGGTATLGVVTGAGAVSVGGGAGLAQFNVNRFTLGSVSVANGGTLTVAAGASRSTNVATALSLTGSGRIDLNTNDLVTNTSTAAVRNYLLAGFTGGTFTGTNGGIFSSTVAADPTHKSIAYISGANTNSATLNAALTNTAATLIRPALIGDFNVDNVVDRFDIRAFNARNAFNDGLTTHDWSDGDLNFDGKVDRFDIRAFNAGNNFNSGVVFAKAQTLTSASTAAVGNTTTVGTVGDGKPDLVYNSTTGDVIFKYDGYDPGATHTILELDIGSSKNSLNANGVNAGAAGSISKGPSDIDYQNLGSTPIADGADLGTIFPTGLTASQLTTNDIVANFFLNGDGSPTKFADVVGAGGVPEPATLSLIGVAAVGVLSRKRRGAHRA